MQYIFLKRDFLSRENLTVLILIFNSFSWYFPLFVFLIDTVNNLGMRYGELLTTFGFHYLAALIFASIGATVASKILLRKKILYLWMLLGILSSPLLILLGINYFPSTYVIFFLLGIALGLGFPSCLAYFADSVNIERRGLIGGLSLFAAHLGMFFMGFLISVLNFAESVLVLTLWRGSGLLLFHTVRPKEKKKIQPSVNVKYKLIFSEKNFILYMIPWLIFCLVNFFELPIQQYYWGIQVSTMVSTAEFGVASIAALIGGYFADKIGRKRLVISGYILLGIGYAMLSIFPTNQVSIGIYALFDGIAWGLFALIFFVIIWADLAGNRIKEKYYLLGELPFILSSYVSIIAAPFAEIIPISASFSLASFFLFLAVIPLMYAPETLPEKEIRHRELKKYIEKAKKLRRKYVKGN